MLVADGVEPLALVGGEGDAGGGAVGEPLLVAVGDGETDGHQGRGWDRGAWRTRAMRSTRLRPPRALAGGCSAAFEGSPEAADGFGGTWGLT